MEAILKFNLDDKDDLMKFNRACKADQLSFFAWSMHFIENKFKDRPEFKEVFDYIHKQENSYNINIEEILE